MIKGLIGSIGRFSRDAAILIAGIYVFVWAFKEINPAYLLEKSEAKQMAYVDRWVGEVIKRLDRMEDKVDRLSPKSLATIPVEVNNNKN